MERTKIFILKKLSMLNTNALRVTNRLHKIRIPNFSYTTTLKTIQAQKEHLKSLLKDC